MLSFLLALQTAAGALPVGFRVDVATDSSRTFVRDGVPEPRRLAIYLWYPARGADGAAMRFGDYLAPPTEPAERGREEGIAYWRGSLERSFDTTFAEPDVRAVLDGPVRARLGAMAAGGRRPVLLLVPGLNAPAYLFVDLAESLAAAGYVVAAVPSFGPADTARLGFDTLGVASQLGDIALAVRHLRATEPVDADRVALGAWSAGGISTLLYASRQGGIAALLSLDAAGSYEYGVDLLRQMGFRASAIRAPVLHFSAGVRGDPPVPRSALVLDGLSPSLTTRLELARYRHADFVTAYGSRFPGQVRPDDPVAEGTRAFLGAAFRADSAGWQRYLARATTGGGPP